MTSPVIESRRGGPAIDPEHPYPNRWSAIVLYENDTQGGWRSTELELEVHAPPRVQPRRGGGWLVQALSSEGDYLHVFDVRGHLEHSHWIGRHVAAFQATSDGRAWIGYSEEAILGTDTGAAALAAFDTNGKRIFSFSELAPAARLPIPLNVNALNVAKQREVWALTTGEYSTVLKIDDLSIGESWVWNNAATDASARGPFGTAIAVDGKHCLIGRDLDPEVVLIDLDTRLSSILRVMYESHPLVVERVQARNQRLWIISDRTIYTVDVTAALAASH